MDKQVKVLFISDSRGRDFLSHPLPDTPAFKIDYLIIGGASIRSLERETLSRLETFAIQSPDSFFIIKIAAGICDVTKKVSHKGGTEIVIRDQTYVLSSLLRFKQKLLSLGLKLLVSIATIPPISFEQALQFNISRNKLWLPRLSKDERSAQQEELFSRLKDINYAIIAENSKSQVITGIGQCRPAQLLWHQQIARETKRRKNSKSFVRIPATALIDGVHAGHEVFLKWSKTLNHSLHQEAEHLMSMSLSNHTV